MKEKIKKIFRSILKFILFWGIVIFAGYIALSQDPDLNWIIRFVGFIATVYFLGKKFYPEKWRKEESLGDILKRELGELTPEELEKLGDLHESICKRQIMETASKDEKVAERIRKAGEILRKNQNK